MSTPPTWWMTEDNLALMRRLWFDPAVSRPEIARRLGISVSALAGKSARMGLPRRSDHAKPLAFPTRRGRGRERLPEEHSPYVPPVPRYHAGTRTLPLLPSERAALAAQGREPPP